MSADTAGAEKKRGRPPKPREAKPVDDVVGDALTEEEVGAARAKIMPSADERLESVEKTVGEIYEIVAVMADEMRDWRNAIGMATTGARDEAAKQMRELVAAQTRTAEGIDSFIHIFATFSRLLHHGSRLSRRRFQALLREIEAAGERLAAEDGDGRRPRRPGTAMTMLLLAVVAFAVYGALSCWKGLGV